MQPRLAAVHSVLGTQLCCRPYTEEQNAISFVETLSQRLSGKGSNGVGNGTANGGNGGGGGGSSPQQPDEEQPASPVDSPLELRAVEVALEMVRSRRPSFFQIVYCCFEQCVGGACTSMSTMVRMGVLDVACCYGSHSSSSAQRVKQADTHETNDTVQSVSSEVVVHVTELHLVAVLRCAGTWRSRQRTWRQRRTPRWTR